MSQVDLDVVISRMELELAVLKRVRERYGKLLEREQLEQSTCEQLEQEEGQR